jgi:hypothetical protein
MKIKTKSANRFLASRQINELIERLGFEAVAAHFIIKVDTLRVWRLEFVPKGRCVEVDEFYRQEISEKVAC